MANWLCRTLPVLFICAVLSLAGCSSPPRSDILLSDFVRVAPDQSVIADAYLFQARLWRDGKPTSLRLQIFDADTITGVSGQGYLGKGAVKGFLRRDSVVVYFPSMNEYMIEDNLDWVWNTSCTMSVAMPNIFSLLDRIPTAYDFEGVAFSDVGRMGDSYAVVVSWLFCPWKLELSYDLRDEQWRLRDFRFDFGDGNRMTAKRNVYKHQTEVSLSKFYPDIPRGAARVIP